MGAAIAGHDIGFIPTASPGFNDKGVRSGHPAAPRYMIDNPSSNEGDLFARMLNEVVVSRIDPSVDSILMINSFNEWHEDTQIEPTIAAAPTNVDDSGVGQYTEGYFYSGYRSIYLDILRAATAPALAGDYDGDGTVAAGDYVVWRNTLGQTGLRLPADGNLNNQIDSGDYNVWRAHFGETAGADAGSADFGDLGSTELAEVSRVGASPSHVAVPEPASTTLLAFGLFLCGRMLYLKRRVGLSAPICFWSAMSSKARRTCPRLD